MLNVVTCLWDPNPSSMDFSRCYSEDYVEKLYRGFKRNLTEPFRFICFVDRLRDFKEAPIFQEMLGSNQPHYGHMIEPFRLNQPMILVGLDTIVIKNIDRLAEYCLTGSRVALPRSFSSQRQFINGVALVPGGWRTISDRWRGENDMDWLCTWPCIAINDLFPGMVSSYKLEVRPNGLGNSAIVYFHGRPKPHDLTYSPWVEENWK